MGMIQGSPFGAPQGLKQSWKDALDSASASASESVFNVSGFGLNGFPPESSGGDANAAADAGDEGPYVPFMGALGWSDIWNGVMGEVLNFYDIDLEHPFKKQAMPGAIAAGSDPTAFSFKA